MTDDTAESRLTNAQAACDKLEASRRAEIAAAEEAFREACRKAGGASAEAGKQLNVARKAIRERYEPLIVNANMALADAKAAAGHFVMKNDGRRARGGQLDEPDNG